MNVPDNIILVGFSGTGKTLVGQEVARLLGWDFIDTDGEIEGKVGKSVQRIFAEDGEPAFREMEKGALSDACSADHRVISTGGGAPVDPENRELMLSRGYVVCLDALPETIYGRLVVNDSNPLTVRPLLSGPEPLARIKALKSQRREYYLAAHRTVATDNLTVEQVAEEILRPFRVLGAI